MRGDANFVYVDGGANVGERVVVTSLDTPINGMAVRVKGDVPPADEPGGDESPAPVAEED